MKLSYFIVSVFFLNQNLYSQTRNQTINHSNAIQIATQHTASMVSSLALNKIQEDSVLAINTFYYQSIASKSEEKLTSEERSKIFHEIESNWKKRLYQNLDHQQFKKFFDQLSENMNTWKKRNDSLNARHH